MTNLHGLPDTAGWDATVDAYAKFAERETGAFAAPLLALAAVRAGEHALDIAAGTGALTLTLATTGATVSAIDWSPGMATHLAARLRTTYPARSFRVEAMDGQALTFADDSFDVALSLFGVMLFPDFRRGLSEMARVVRPGGRCAIGSWVDLTAPMRLLHDAAAMIGQPQPDMAVEGMAAMATVEGMTAELTGIGLTEIRTEQVTLPWRATRRDVAETSPQMLALMPPWPSLSDGQRRDVQAAMHIIADRDAALPFESTAMLGVGRKPG